MRIDFGTAPKGHRHSQIRVLNVADWINKYERVIFNVDALTDPMEVIYFEPVIGWEGVIQKEFNAHIMAMFRVVENSVVEYRLYIVPKRLLKGIA